MIKGKDGISKKMLVSIKISEDNYKTLSVLSGRLRETLHRPVSINETISFLYKKRAIKNRLSDLAGSWKMNDKEAREFIGELKRGWMKWSIRSV